ncbi:MAG TPA: gamma-glutamyl-gamma-aminobutyrate hydrolase family protein [Desulfitobacterium dehalogenans]|uniref:Gamma-glutamyl-gamma-aminobutyrate hydrolase family protein n=1 Tax=Desulfitobacterium dehalogenans TaxID=36854 RepID=A0A7C6Z7C0_9FIRM|nr:gamma-glutamyl-gamma-aminobutyrate hydrolase family protein [Desulfitobacterium dehalogenans]
MKRKPVIGITAAHCNEELKSYPRARYVEAVMQAGGQPILLPPLATAEDAEEIIALIDGLILTGGGDISPILLGEDPLRGIGDCMPDRDFSEILLTQKALEVNLPLLGICKGIQVLAVAAGGKIFQDIISQYPDSMEHKMKAPRDFPWHEVTLRESLLRTFLGEERIVVNSVHHQAVSEVPQGFVISALAPDGIVEGIEKVGDHFCIGVQWHPEVMVKDKNSQKIFQELVKSGSEYYRKKIL